MFFLTFPRFSRKSHGISEFHLQFSPNFPRFPPFFHAFFSVTSRRQGTHGHQGIHGFGPTEATRDGLEERQGGGPEDRTGLRPLLTNEKTHSRSC